ncbi:MAG: ankyrin repeat domain-containing protein, partial [Gemmatimonadota bacterium]|nr:ankyrin repeat domain-containing protein [Gemmatimonadota bacterium]
MNPQDERHEALLQKYDLVSKLLTAEPVENEKLKEFRTLFKGDFMAFANGESSLAEEASALDKLRIVESRLEEVVAFPHIFTKTSIAIGGGFSAGKSEFVNSFITQTDIRMPVAIQPATAIPSFVVSAADDSVMGFSRNKGTVDIPRALYNRLTHDFISTFSFNLKDIMPSMTVKVPLCTGLFENICLIDTPGYNPSGGNTDSDRETASDFLRDRDALIWMIGLDATGTIPQSDLEFLHDMELDKLPLYVVLSKADTRPPTALAEILAEVQGTLEDEDIGYVGISVYSSTRREEYLFEGMSLDEFFREQNRHDGRLETILEGEIKGVFKMYRDAIRKDSVEAERLKERLDDLSYKVQEMVGDAGDEHDELDLTIERIKRAQSDKVAQFKQQIEQAEQIREKVLGAMEAVFRSLGVPRGEEYVDSAERQRQEQVFVESVGRLPSLDPRIVDEEGKTDLHIAADLNLSVLVLSLLKTSPTNLLLLQVKDKKGATLLHTAAMENACETAEVLLEYGADLNA